MAFNIAKKDQKRIEEIIDLLKTQEQAIQTAVFDYNEVVNEARGKVDDELAVLNEIREELRGVIEDIHSEKEGEYDDKSDNWRDGERGEATREWISVIEEFKSELENEIEIEAVEDMVFDISDLTDKLDEGVPSEPSY